ncbi:MAG TPA: FAD-dependent oxidoreductase [Gemmatimonadaceae bacterium]|nr:FAD-dependent oxidoreductase [Gemmatimonadaceae bacterium]
MAQRPVLLTVDDDPEVLRAVERDLRRRYGESYRVLRADSARAALELLEELKRRGDPVALLLADQRMPEMTGVEFLERAITLAPGAKRVLLTAYADTDAAIQAINKVRIHYYLMKPWDPPEQNLYPYLTDLLEDWRATYRPPFEGIRVIGNRWSPRAHRVRDFLGRNTIPFQWLDLDTSGEARDLLAMLAQPAAGAPPDERSARGEVREETADGHTLRPPVVLFPDGSHLADPELPDLAQRIGLRTRAERPFYDLVVVGGGPAGLAAAVYGASEGLRTLLVEREAPGGQAGTSSNIENYLGFPTGLTGGDLARRAVAQARKFGAEILTPQEVRGVRTQGPYRVLTLGDGSEVSSRVLLVSTGVEYRKLDVPGAEALTGRGVYYGGALTEALSCRDEELYIVGGGNSAGQAAVYFAQYARSVTILVRGEGLAESMSQYLIDQIAAVPNIAVLARTRVAAVEGEQHLERLTLACGTETRTVPAASLFIFIGAVPRTEWLGDLVERDEYGFILTGPDLPRVDDRVKGWPLERDPYLLETNVPGVLCAGDVRHQSVKRVASAVGEGSIAVQFTHRYLAET